MPPRKVPVASVLSSRTPVTDQTTPSPPPPANPHADEMDRQHRKMKEKLSSLAKKTIEPLSAYKGTHVTDSQLKQLGISLNTLDFYTGKPGNGQQQYIEPIPIDTMKAWLSKTKPWKVRRDFVHNNDNALAYNPQWEATWLWELINIWLKDADDERAYGIMPTQTRWKKFR